MKRASRRAIERCLRAGLPILVCGLAPESVRAQSPFPADDPVAAAEAHGVAFPRPDSVRPLPDITRELVGTSRRQCVAAPTREEILVRSGEMLMGGHFSYPLFNGGAKKIWWHPFAAETPLDIRVVAQRRDDPSQLVEWVSTQPTVASGMPRTPENLYFPGGLLFPSVGEWVVVATSGASWGCLIVDAWEGDVGATDQASHPLRGRSGP